MRLRKASAHNQRGVSLFIVLIILLLSLIVVLGGLAVSNLNEALVGNQSDAQRANGTAEALLDAAQRDIRLNGRYCNATGLGQPGNNSAAVIEGQSTACTLRYPRDGNGMSDYMALVGTVGGIGRCAYTARYQGICISGSPTNSDFNIIPTNNNPPAASKVQVWSNGADYNANFGSNNSDNSTDYGSSAKAGSGANAAISLALGTGSNARGKYWVEIFPYNVMGIALTGTANVPVPDGTYPFVFRITAMATGLRSGTVSVLRTYYVPYPMALN